MSKDNKGLLDVIISYFMEAFKSAAALFDKFVTKEGKGKKMYNWIIVLGMVVLVAMAYNLLNNSLKPKQVTGTGDMAVVQENTGGNEDVNSGIKSHKEKKEEELEALLEELQGGGNVKVSIHFASSEEKIIAMDVSENESVTQENDEHGGTREIKSTETGSNAVTLSEGDKSVPVVTKVIEPEILGIVVVADKASSKNVRDEMKEAVATLYHLSPNRVQVYPTGCEYDN